MAHESTCSLLWRVAGAQGVGVGFLLDELGEGPDGQQALQPHLAEVFLSRAAADRLAQLLGVPSARLRWALPHLREPHLLPGEQPRWEWPWRPLAHYLVPACGLCAAARGGHWGEVWLVWPDRWRICERHGRFTHVRQGGPGGVDLARLPESVRAHRGRGRLERRFGPGGAVLVADAFALTGWWWRRDPFTPRWIERAGRAGLQPADVETAWLLVYPEALEVARALLRYEQRRAAGPGGPWAAAESRLMAELAQLADTLALTPGRWQVPVAEWLDRHQRCAPAAGDDEAGGRRRPVTALVHRDDENQASLEDRCCLPWDWSDPFAAV
ncbi:TniQ family protein [Streptomyces sennicomposti]|uniref:TniQ family protein n=1 Tax=Streptomyces sennicomposti TaxID=2873384 RepID=UPI001CA73727|nr:TniQ family protein [Streptomyces sennicomposti]MBY8864490.1 TniQ family protein [Streptomyces sennicomposti]